MANRRRMHGRKRHPSRCTAPFKQLDTNKPTGGEQSQTEKSNVLDYLKFPTLPGTLGSGRSVGDVVDMVTGEGYWQYDSDDPAGSIMGKILGETGEHERKRIGKEDTARDIDQVGASIAGVGNPMFDVWNAGESVSRAAESLVGVNRPRNTEDAKTHGKAALYNVGAIAPVIEGASITSNVSKLPEGFNFAKGAKELSESLIGKGDDVIDAIGTVGNWGYWFDKDTGTVSTIYKGVTGQDQVPWE